jgi:hypothetical protein
MRLNACRECAPAIRKEQESAEREQIQHNLTRFFEAMAQYVNENVLEPDDMVVRGACGHKYIAKFVGYDSIKERILTACPECAEFERACEAEYQEAQAVIAAIKGAVCESPSFVSRYAELPDNLAKFFKALAMIAIQDIDIIHLSDEDLEVFYAIYANIPHAPVILDEYCYAHRPGGWQCIFCYQYAQFAAESIISLKHCPSCHVQVCPECQGCHSLHCKHGVLMSVECGEAMDMLSKVQRGEIMLDDEQESNPLRDARDIRIVALH